MIGGEPGTSLNCPLFISIVNFKGEINMAKQLPTFKGYTVGVRLKEFRKADPHRVLRFVRFNSPLGDKLLEGFIETLDADTTEGRELLTAIW